MTENALAPGDIVANRYRVERRLAGGGMGVVYAAEHVETEQKIALKVLIPDVAGSQEALDRFRLESRVFARLSSEHIVRVVDAGIDDERGVGFIAMELLEGETLHGLVARAGPLGWETLVALFVQIASALDRAHGYVDKDGAPRPIVHRDLKPENVFVTMRADGRLHAKVLDFGIAKIASVTAAVSTELRGTPQYMAPEQVEGNEVTPRTDIAALGLSAFFCLTGKSYWKAASDPKAQLAQLVREILKGTSVTASERAKELGAPAVPTAFDGWFARATALEPEERFASAGDAALALGAALGVPATLPDTGPVRVPPTSGLGAIAAPPTRSGDPATQLASTVHAPPRSRLAPLVVVVGLVVAAVVVWRVAVKTTIGTLTTSASTSASASASAERGPPVVPLPTAGKQEAIDAFADALSAFRDANRLRYRDSLDNAVRLDPTFVPARVRLAVGFLYDEWVDLPTARDSLAVAASRRDALAPRERALYDAAAQLYAADPPDSEAFIVSLRPLVEASPRDAELLAIFGKALQAAGHLDEATSFVDRALALDPGFAFAYVIRADIAWSVGDVVERRRVFDECVARFPRAIECIGGRSWVVGEFECDELVADARRVIAIEPTFANGYSLLVDGLLALDRSEAEVMSAQEQNVARLPARLADLGRLLWSANLAVVHGHFAEADALARSYLERHPSDLRVGPAASWLRLDLAEEAGDLRSAATIATDMLAHEPLWSPDWMTIRGELLAAALRVGAIDRVRFDREIASFRAKLPSLYRRAPYFRDANDRVRFWAWADGLGRSMVSDADAVEALRRFSDEKIVAVSMGVSDDYAVGEVLLRAGRPVDARPALNRAAKACHPFDGGFASGRKWVRAALYLGRALEATGGRPGACASYARVLARWGSAKRSVTADEARARSKKLGCGPP